MLGKLDWRAFLKACKEVNASEDLPEEIPRAVRLELRKSNTRCF